MSKTYQIFAWSEVMSPLTHMKGVEGNEALIQREPVVTASGVRYVPALSGNALRHRLVRAGAMYLIERWNLAGKLSMPQLNFLMHGGALTEGGARENTNRIAAMERLFPLIRLLGGSLPDQILAGSALVWRGTLVCEENRERIARCAPSDWTPTIDRLRPAESYVDGYQYTRGDSAKTAAHALPANAGDAPSNLMIFSGQCVLVGAAFTHGFVLRNVSDLELGALLFSLRLWQSAGGTVGGQSSRGHGRLATSIHLSDDAPDEGAVVDAYLAHVDAVKDEAIAFLNSCFSPPKESRPARGKKGKPDATTEDNLLA